MEDLSTSMPPTAARSEKGPAVNSTAQWLSALEKNQDAKETTIRMDNERGGGAARRSARAEQNSVKNDARHAGVVVRNKESLRIVAVRKFRPFPTV